MGVSLPLRNPGVLGNDMQIVIIITNSFEIVDCVNQLQPMRVMDCPEWHS